MRNSEATYKITSRKLNGYKSLEEEPDSSTLLIQMSDTVNKRATNEKQAQSINTSLSNGVEGINYDERGTGEEMNEYYKKQVTAVINSTIDDTLKSANLTQTVGDMKEAIKTTSDELGSAQSAYADAKEQSDSINGQLEVANRQLADLKSQQEELEKSIKKLTDELENPDLSPKEKKKKDTELKKLKGELDTNKANQETTTATIDKLMEEKPGYDNTLTEATKKRDILSTNLEKQKADLNNKESLEDIRKHLFQDLDSFLIGQPEGTFRDNLTANLLKEIQSIDATLVSMADQLKTAIDSVFEDLYEQGSHGGTVLYSDVWQDTSNLNNFVTNLSTFKEKMTALLGDAQTASLKSSQSISRANLAASEFSSQFRVLKPTIGEAELHKQGDDDILNRLEELTLATTGEECSHSPFGTEDQMETLDNGAEIRRIDYAELNAVQCTTTVAQLNKTITENGFPAVDSAGTMVTAIKTEFDAQVAAITTNVGTLETDMGSYATADYNYRVADATVDADDIAYAKVTSITENYAS